MTLYRSNFPQNMRNTCFGMHSLYQWLIWLLCYILQSKKKQFSMLTEQYAISKPRRRMSPFPSRSTLAPRQYQGLLQLFPPDCRAWCFQATHLLISLYIQSGKLALHYSFAQLPWLLTSNFTMAKATSTENTTIYAGSKSTLEKPTVTAMEILESLLHAIWEKLYIQVNPSKLQGKEDRDCGRMMDPQGYWGCLQGCHECFQDPNMSCHRGLWPYNYICLYRVYGDLLWAGYHYTNSIPKAGTNLWLKMIHQWHDLTAWNSYTNTSSP